MADDAPGVVAGETIVAPPAETTPTDETRNDNETGTEAPEEAKPDEPEKAEAEDTDKAEPKDEKKNVPGSQRLKRRLALIEADASAALSRAEEAERKLAAMTPRADAKPGVDRAPTEADFPNDYFAYERALQSWNTELAINRALERARAPERERLQREAERELIESYNEYVEEVRERIPDFDKVIATAKDVTIKPELHRRMLASPKSALLQYHLANNHDQARELNRMSGEELAVKLARLEDRLSLPKPKKATEATPPPTQVRGGATSVTRPEDADDMETYIALRKKQGAFK